MVSGFHSFTITLLGEFGKKKKKASEVPFKGNRVSRVFSVQGLNLFVHLKSWLAAGSQPGLPLSIIRLCPGWEEERSK